MTTSPPARGSLTHEPDRFSDEAWDLLLAGQDVARRWRHEQLDVEHLLQVLFSDPAFRRWIAPLSVRPEDLLDRLEDVLAEQPVGRGDELFIGEDLEELLEAAERARQRWGSRLIDVPHVLLALGRDRRIGAELFAGLGLTADRLEAQLRQPVTPPSPNPRPADPPVSESHVRSAPTPGPGPSPMTSTSSS